MRLICTVILLAYALSACGLKGPLYLPQTDEASRATPGEIERK